MIEEKRTYATFRLLPLPDIVDIPDALGSEWVFRGQAAAEWEISSSLDREIDRFYNPARTAWHENLIRSDFESRTLNVIKSVLATGLYADLTPRDDFSWLALLQHHGCKTRMVDFTESFCVAVYFAVRDLPEHDAVVWVIRTSALDEKTESLSKLCCAGVPNETIGRTLVINSIECPQSIQKKRWKLYRCVWQARMSESTDDCTARSIFVSSESGSAFYGKSNQGFGLNRQK